MTKQLKSDLCKIIHHHVFLCFLSITLLVAALVIGSLTVIDNIYADKSPLPNKESKTQQNDSSSDDLQITLIHIYWRETVKIVNNRFCRNTGYNDCAFVVFKDNQIIVKWEKWPWEIFIQSDKKNSYVLQKTLNTPITEEIEQNYSSFDYSLKEPFILVNPYKIAPLTALIKFPTKQKARITLTIHGKDDSPDITHTFPTFENEHSLPVLGLYANYENTVTITAEFEDKSIQKNTVHVQTGNIPLTTQWFVQRKTDNQFYYYASYTGDVYDEKGHLRYFLNLPNGHHAYFFKDKIFAEYPNGINRYNLLGELEKHYSYPANFYTYVHGMGHKPNGNLLVFGSFNNTTALIDGKNLPTHRDFVLELDYETGKEVARYDLAEMLNPDRSLIVKSTEYDYNKIDWAHTNGITYDAENKAVIVSGRHFGIAKIDEKTKKLLWWFTPHQQVNKSGRNGKNGSLKNKVLTVVDKNGKPYPQAVQEGIETVPDFKWPLKTHNILYAGNGIYSIFDNSGELFDKKLKTTKNSYASIYKINDKKRTVHQLFLKDLNFHAEMGSLVYIHPVTKEIWVSATTVPIEHNRTRGNTIVMRLNKGEEVYRAIIPATFYYAVVPIQFYENNFLFPIH